MQNSDMSSIFRGLRNVVTALVNLKRTETIQFWSNSSVWPALSELLRYQPCHSSSKKSEGFERFLAVYQGLEKYASLDETPFCIGTLRPPRANSPREETGLPTVVLTKTEKDAPRYRGSTEKKFQLDEHSRERRVPSSRMGRFLTYGGLAAGLGLGALAEATRRSVGLGSDTVSPLLSEANANRLVSTLCRVRGAALKLGQMLSLQDSKVINPQLQAILERVRQSADFMPTRQMENVMKEELGSDWRSKLAGFEEKPFAAASIGQVHLGILKDGREVAIKIQYPGVAKGIDSDINNLLTVLKIWNILPRGLFIENLTRVARKELAWEVDYVREAGCTRRFKELLRLHEGFRVPDVVDELSTARVLTTELVEGTGVDQLFCADQKLKNWIGEMILKLVLMELFQFKYMQTDPNWSNFLYDEHSHRLVLLDFGASRAFDDAFIDDYLRVIAAASEGDRRTVLELSRKLRFLTGYETKAMENAHVDAVMTIGEPFRHDGPFDFATQDTTGKVFKLMPVMLRHRLTPPPDESYSIHRKLAGIFLLCSKLGAKVDCSALFRPIYDNYSFKERPEPLTTPV